VQRIASISHGSWGRINAWKIAVKGFKARPLLGWGWENYNVVFNQFYNPESLLHGSAETWFDRSHNQILDILCLTGIFGLFSYLAIFLILFKLFRKSWLIKRKDSLAILFFLLFAYFVQNLFVFDTPGPMIIFFFSLGLFYFWTKEEQETEVKAKAKTSNFPLPVLLMLLFIFLPWAIYEFNIKPLKKSNQGIRGIITSLVDLKTGLYWYGQSLGGDCFTNPELRLQLAKTMFVASDQGKEGQEIMAQGIKMAVEENKKNVQEHPYDVRYYLYLGQLYNANPGLSPDYLKEAEKVLTQGLTFSPKRQEVFYELGKTKMLLGKNKEAIALYQQALELNKKVKRSHWNLGLAYILDNDYKQGLAEIKKAQEMGMNYPKDPTAAFYIGRAFQMEKEYSRAISVYELVLKWQPDYVPAIKEKIFCYLKLNNQEQAQKELERLEEIAPEEAKKLN